MAYSEASSELTIKYLFTGDTITRPSGFTVAMYNGDPENGGTEFSDTDYARQGVTFTAADPDVDGRWEVTNDAAVQFPAVLDAGGDVDTYVVFDSAVADRIIAIIPMGLTRTLVTGDVVEIDANDLVIKAE